MSFAPVVTMVAWNETRVKGGYMEEVMRMTMLRGAFFGSQIFQHLSPKFTAKLGTFMWFTPVRKKPHSDRNSLAKISRERILPLNGASIILRTWGEENGGKHIVLVHGWGGRWDQFSEFIRHFVNHGNKITSFDFPAHGESKGLSTNAHEWFDVLEGVQKSFDGEELIYLCHSFGFAPLSHAILERGLKARALIAVNSPNRFDFLLNQFLHKVRLGRHLTPYLVKEILKVVNGVENIATVPLETLRGTTEVLYVVDETDREVPFKEQQRASEVFGDNFVSIWGHGHNRILKAEVFFEKVEVFVASL